MKGLHGIIFSYEKKSGLRELIELECDTSAVSNAARLIREGTPAAKAAADSGFTDYSAFHRAFRESFGMSPGKLKK